MQLEIDTTGVRISRRAYEKAIKTTLNKTATTIKSEMSKAVTQYYNIKATTIKSKMKITKASAGEEEMKLKIASRPIGLIHFGATKSIAKRKGNKIYYKTKAKVLKADRKKVIKGAFIAKAKNSGALQVFRRSADKSLPIVKLGVLSPTKMIEKRAMDIPADVIDRDFNRKFMQNYNYFLSRERR
ncbi:MAG: phage tail protein [Campylobacterota bacterium]|nr:phage tail protein [Campylobacterota bacterium]